MTEFKARRPFIKNIIRLVLALGVTVALAVIFLRLHVDDPVGFEQKLTQCIIFCVFVVWEVFSLSFFADSLRNMLAPPTVSVKDGVLRVFGYPPVELSSIERTEMTDLARNPKKSFPAVAVYIKDAEEPIIIKKNLTGLPLDTVKYAIDVRI